MRRWNCPRGYDKSFSQGNRVARRFVNRACSHYQGIPGPHAKPVDFRIITNGDANHCGPQFGSSKKRDIGKETTMRWSFQRPMDCRKKRAWKLLLLSV